MADKEETKIQLPNGKIDTTEQGEDFKPTTSGIFLPKSARKVTCGFA